MKLAYPTRCVLRTDGTVEPLEWPGSLDAYHANIRALIGCERTDSVMLADRIHVMILDDAGYEFDVIEERDPATGNVHIEHRVTRALKPVNAEATRLYHAVCLPGTTHEIVGDVVIVPDSDFAPPYEGTMQ